MVEPLTHCIACDGQMLKVLAEAGKQWLQVHYEKVNRLNVFPVPDGDTGINMLLTIRNAYQEIVNETSTNVAYIARRLAYGAIMGSRGNSGTIMSQIWVGFSQALGEAEQFDLRLAAYALREASNKARQGVQTPVEGTILTVIREIAEEAEAVQETTTNLLTLMERIVERGWDAVARTPQMLPTLKEAGVVDSGGAGLVYIFEGMLKYLRGDRIEAELSLDDQYAAALAELDQEEVDLSKLSQQTYNYDVQFMIKGQNLIVDQIKRDIEAMGDSGVIIGSDTLVKVHIHVDDPGVPLSYGVRLGILEAVVVENMQAQYEALLEKQAAKPVEVRFRQVEAGEMGVIAVASGMGLIKVFSELGVNAVIEGGQTNNPSTEQILAAARQTGTDRVIVLPNNKNIILTAQQAAQLSSDIQLVVVPTVSIPQGVAAMLAYEPSGALEAVVKEMEASKQLVISGEITTATRNVELDGIAVRERQIIGLLDGKLKAARDTVDEAVETLLSQVDLSDRELITLYYGEAVRADQAAALAQKLSQRFGGVEVEVVYGGQPHYHYILGIE